MKNLKLFIRKFILFVYNYRVYRFYSNQFKRYMRMLSYKNVKASGEEAYLEKWQNLSNRIEPYSYRHFTTTWGEQNLLI